MGVGGQHHAPPDLPPGNTRYPLYRRLGRPQDRSRRVRKISSPPGFDPRTVQPVASRYSGRSGDVRADLFALEHLQLEYVQDRQSASKVIYLVRKKDFFFSELQKFLSSILTTVRRIRKIMKSLFLVSVVCKYFVSVRTEVNSINKLAIWYNPIFFIYGHI